MHLAVFCDEATELGHGLGARTMPETRRYSSVCALYTFWLAARASGLGVGWVSILDPAEIARGCSMSRRPGRSSAISASAGRKRRIDAGTRARGLATPRRADADRPLRLA